MQPQSRSPKRTVNGILLLDKPTHITSNGALQTVKKLYFAAKAGHTGSLDPLASGMLPICFGEATKFSQFLLDADKCYRVVAQLGAQTTTGDAEGEIVEQKPIDKSAMSRLETVLKSFRGAIQQVPSMYSALKYQGRPLYELARQGITVDRPARTVQIYELILLAQTEDTLTLEVSCSKGTYIRTLVEDIGLALGCGAYVAELRRLTVATYQEAAMISLEQLQDLRQEDAEAHTALDAYLLPVDSMVQGWPKVTLSEAAFYYLKRGQPVIIPHAPTEGWVRLYLGEKQFLGVGEILDDGKVAPRRLVQ